MPTQPISADTLGTYLPAMLIPAVDLTQPVGSRNVKLNASSFLGVLTTTFSIQAATTDSTMTGGNARGNYAVDLQGVSQRGAAAQVASGANSVAAGTSNTASGTAAVSLGTSNTASGSPSFAAGGYNQANNTYSVCLGGANTAAQAGSVTLGVSGTDRLTNNSLTFSGGTFSVAGDSQIKWNVFKAITTTTTGVRMTTDGAGATANNLAALPVLSSSRISGKLVANSGGTLAKEWTIDALVRVGAAATNTVLVGSAATSTFGDAGLSTCTVTLVADTVTGALSVTVAGVAATTIHWVFRYEVVEAV